jgi:ABC-type multidrug transport system fused ATPase/permease subunit
MKGRTSLVIAHRLSTIKHADKILVIEKGKIKDQGNHDQLMETSEIYQRLNTAQGMA